jgi:signal transduction histidine kinase
MTIEEPRDRTALRLQFDRLVWIRWFAAGALAAMAILAQIRGYLDTLGAMLAVVAFILGYNLLFWKSRWARRRLERAAIVSLVLDTVALTAFLAFSGDLENPLRFAYALPVAAGATVLSHRAAILLASIATILFVILLSMIILDFPIPVQHHHLDLHEHIRTEEIVKRDIALDEAWDFLLVHLLALAFVLFGAAFGFGTLADHVRKDRAEVDAAFERMRLILDTVPEGIGLIDADGRVALANSAARKLVPEIAQNKPLSDIQPDVAELVTSLDSGVREIESRSDAAYLVHTLARRASDGPAVWIVRDVTERQRLMAEVIHRSKMADLGLLAAGIAHELGNPLSSMQAIVELIEFKAEAPQIAPQITSLRSHIDRMARILQDVTSFGRPSADRRQRVSAAALVDKALEIFRMHRRARDSKVEFAAPPDPVQVDVVEDQLVQVLLNLLLNGADAMRGGGRLTVAVSASGGQARISVSDTGSGMDSGVLRKLFTPFYTTKDPGMGVGLGLFVSDSIVREHGGRIDVRSSPGKGSTFAVLLPQAD